ncbi:MAG: hypothetical protein DBY25_04575 [Clostridiales bacterium]|nr:MAG: hypothetical protein DBY25_04575 [Clostridiales bacterium]
MRRSEFESLKPGKDEIISLYTGNVQKVERLDLQNGMVILPDDDFIRYQDCTKAKQAPEILGFRLHKGVYQAKVIDNGLPSWNTVYSIGDNYYVMVGNVITHDRKPVYFSADNLREYFNFVDETLPPRLFVDMDGTLAVFQAVDRMERLYEKGYFLDLPPIPNVVRAIQQLYEQHSCDIYILSAVVDSPFAVPEKNEWLDRYLPEISKSRRLFIPCGENKAEYVPYGVRETDVLLDDYTKNLLAWPEKGVKLLNGINHTNGRWRGDCLDASLNPDELLQQLVSCLPENQPAFTYDTGDYEIE